MTREGAASSASERYGCATTVIRRRGSTARSASSIRRKRTVTTRGSLRRMGSSGGGRTIEFLAFFRTSPHYRGFQTFFSSSLFLASLALRIGREVVFGVKKKKFFLG